MKIYGPFHALNNPLVMANMGLFALRQGLDVYNQYQKTQGDEFLKAALVTGKPVESMPGGPFRKGLSALTGGLVSPDVEASGSTMMDELLGLQQQRSAAMKEVAPLAKEFGSAALGPGGPFAGEAARAGLGGTALPQTIDEQKFAEEQRKNKMQQDIAQQRLFQGSPEGKKQAKIAETEGQIEAESTPAYRNLMTGLAYSKGKAAAEGRVAGEATPGAINLSNNKAFQNAAARVAGEAAGEDQLTLPQYRAKRGIAYYNSNDLSLPSPKLKKIEADQNQDLMPVKVGKDEDDLKKTRAIYNKLDAFEKSPAFAKIFPRTGPANDAATNLMLANRAKHNWNVRTTDPDIQTAYGLRGDVLAYIRTMQGRVSVNELSTVGSEVYPEPGGFYPKAAGGLSLLGIPGMRQTDSYDVAKSKIDNIKRELISRFKNDVAISTSNDTNSAADDILERAKTGK